MDARPGIIRDLNYIDYEVKLKKKRTFEVKLRFWANCIDITHPVTYYEKDAYDEGHAKELAWMKFPQISEGTLEITEYNGD